MTFWNFIGAFVWLNYACIYFADSQCILPFTNGTWITSSRGTWTIPESRTEIRNFKATIIPSQSLYDLTCLSSSGNKYILETPSFEIFPGFSYSSYTCMEIQASSISPSKYEFYFVPDVDASSNEPFSINVTAICDGTASVTGPNTNIAVLEGTDGTVLKETLPDVIRGEYQATVTDQNDVTVNETLIHSCDDTSTFHVTEIVNATQTLSPVGFSETGVLFNMKSFSFGGITYIYTYNNDSTVNTATTYRFSCWAVSRDAGSSIVYATVYPEVCQQGQNATYVPSGGQVLILDPSVTCVDDTSKGLSLLIIVVIVVVCVIVVVTIIIITIYCIRKKKRKDMSKPLPKNTKEDDAALKKGPKRPKSTNDLDSARLIDEKNKQKLAKKLAKTKETRTIAVQASIWTAPIKRTTTALIASVKRSTSKESVKFIPYVDQPVIKTDQQVKTISSAIRSKTTLETTDVETNEQPMKRSKTSIENKSPRSVPKYLQKKTKTSSPRQKLMKQISNIDTHSLDHYANEFEKLNPFPNEGNPNEFHNTLDIPDESKKGQDNIISESVEHQEQYQKEIKKETTRGVQSRSYTKTSLRSRPSTTDGNLVVNINRSGSVRKTNSEQMNRCQTILKYSYHSPYAMSESQKKYFAKKTLWIRQQVKRDTDSKKHFEEMKKLESQRAFDAWIKNKKKSITSIRRKFSKSSTRTTSINKPPDNQPVAIE